MSIGGKSFPRSSPLALTCCKHTRGGPTAAFSHFATFRDILSAAVASKRSSREESVSEGKEKKRCLATNGPSAVSSVPWRPFTTELREVSEHLWWLTAEVLWRSHFLGVCLSWSLTGKGRGVMEVGEAVAAAGDGGLGAHIDLCHFSAAPSLLHLLPTLSPYTSVHITHTFMHTPKPHTHTHTHTDNELGILQKASVCISGAVILPNSHENQYTNQAGIHLPS